MELGVFTTGGTGTVAIGWNQDDDGQWETVVYFPEPGADYMIQHNVPSGDEEGCFTPR